MKVGGEEKVDRDRERGKKRERKKREKREKKTELRTGAAEIKWTMLARRALAGQLRL